MHIYTYMFAVIVILTVLLPDVDGDYIVFLTTKRDILKIAVNTTVAPPSHGPPTVFLTTPGRVYNVFLWFHAIRANHIMQDTPPFSKGHIKNRIYGHI